MQGKNCIFHIPNHIDKEGKSGSSVRPLRMIKAFEEQGYNVDVIMGYGKERKIQISEIKKSIKKGKKYDFLYSESSTMPTLLTEKNHLPMYPFLDFEFLKFCKERKIKIGLFYRDIYWKFPIYKEKVHGIKYLMAQLCYRYDLQKYKQLLTKFYLPTLQMGKYVGEEKLREKADELPPGAEVNLEKINMKHNYFNDKRVREKISIFYVGGLTGHYSISKLLELVGELNFVELTVCCPKDAWNEKKSSYEKYLNERISIVHKYSCELDDYYQKADLCIAWFEPSEYMKFAVPIKIFEYLGKTIPIVATSGTVAGDFVERNNIGWAVSYDKKELKSLLQKIYSNQYLLMEKHENCRRVLTGNTWNARAEKVINDLSR